MSDIHPTKTALDVSTGLPAYGIPFTAGAARNFESLGYGKSRRVMALEANTISAVTYAARGADGNRIAVATSFPLPAGACLDTAGIIALTHTAGIIAFFD